MIIKDLINLKRIYKFYKLLQKGINNKQLFKSFSYREELVKSLIEIREVKEMLKGYKTYIVAILTAALTVAKSLGYIDDQTYQTLIALLGAGALGTVAAKINRIANNP